MKKKIWKKIFKSYKYIYLNRVFENSIYNTQSLNYYKFLIQNAKMLPQMNKLGLYFSLENVAFQKKKALSFFLALELLTGQKCIVTLAKADYLHWKVRKGQLIGCSVTLRRKNLFNFIDTLLMTLPKVLSFQGWYLTHEQQTNHLFFLIKDLLLFHVIENTLRHKTVVTEMSIFLSMNTFIYEERNFVTGSLKLPVMLITPLYTNNAYFYVNKKIYLKYLSYNNI